MLLETARILNFQFPDSKQLFVFVGGTGKELEDFRNKADGLKNVLVLGHKPYIDIPRYLKAADVLALPNSGISQDARFAIYSQKDTSPIKLFEYMASGTPIIASCLPSIREILNEENAFLVLADSPEAFLVGIEKILDDTKYAESIAMGAKKESAHYTWIARAERILGYMRNVLHIQKNAQYFLTATVLFLLR